MNPSLLKDGLVPQNKACPFAGICGIRAVNECEQDIRVPTNCALARGYDEEQQNETYKENT